MCWPFCDQSGPPTPLIGPPCTRPTSFSSVPVALIDQMPPWLYHALKAILAAAGDHDSESAGRDVVSTTTVGTGADVSATCKRRRLALSDAVVNASLTLSGD